MFMDFIGMSQCWGEYHQAQPVAGVTGFNTWSSSHTIINGVLPVAVTGSPNLLCCILRYFTDFAFCCCVI